MQKLLKNVSSLTNRFFFYCLIVCVFSFNLIYSQRAKFSFNGTNFFITENSKIVYETNLNTGICNLIEIKDSYFKNQFYLYTENTCTLNITKHFFKINWENNKFRILSKEIIEINRGVISCKNIFYENLIIDTLDINKIEVEENDLFINKNKKINNIIVKFKNKIIGYMQITSQDAYYNYPLVDNYSNIKANIILYNDIAFILFKNNCFIESKYILKKVIKQSPRRIVAHLNIADCYWELNQKSEAKASYLKYLSLMKTQKKDLKKVPKRVYERMK